MRKRGSVSSRATRKYTRRGGELPPATTLLRLKEQGTTSLSTDEAGTHVSKRRETHWKGWDKLLLTLGQVCHDYVGGAVRG